MPYQGKSVIVTGGSGFIGSNLTLRLVREGAHVTVVDPCVPGCGGDPRNLRDVLDRVRILGVDIAQPAVFEDAIRQADVVFNLAGEISHIHSMMNPERDLQLNTTSQLRFLQACANWNPGVRVVFAGTRQVYGVPEYLPVDEDHPINPVDFNGIHKYAATMYHLMLSRTGLLDACVLRLTNVYGPRMSLTVPGQGFLSAYLRKLELGEPLQVFGDGQQLRDPLHVDDAVEAFLMVGAARPLPSRSYNIGGPEALSLLEITRIACATAGLPEPTLRPFPAERASIDIGSYRTDSSRIRAELGWAPQVRFEDGFAQALGFYRRQAAAHGR
ncbi:MAG: NAD-dependent epimerase/dehydratase family protein [Bryobacteraceae bacterium]|nr:NAD-dependent epimerase/dehydratase family protein [Bryobacteraceae bacterium]